MATDAAIDLNPEAPPAQRAPVITQRLRAAHPAARCALHFENPFQLLVATILSAQSTDERVNAVTPELFKKYPDPDSFAAADRSELEESIHSTGFFRQKAKYIQESSRIIVAQHDGATPREMDALTALPGVARKTANVVLGVGFGVAAGVVVDTHVRRLSNRLDLTNESDPVKIERDLMALVPQSDWIDISHLLIFHGRRVCKARTPDCVNCTLNDLCPAAELLSPRRRRDTK